MPNTNQTARPIMKIEEQTSSDWHGWLNIVNSLMYVCGKREWNWDETGLGSRQAFDAGMTPGAYVKILPICPIGIKTHNYKY